MTHKQCLLYFPMKQVGSLGITWTNRSKCPALATLSIGARATLRVGTTWDSCDFKGCRANPGRDPWPNCHPRQWGGDQGKLDFRWRSSPKAHRSRQAEACKVVRVVSRGGCSDAPSLRLRV